MGKKAIDSRIPGLIRNGIQTKERSLFILVGDKAREQLPNIHYLMSSSDLKLNKSVLWAYKKKLLGFTSHRKKREQKIKKDIKRGIREPNSEDPFELFITLNNIRYVYYKETENILGNTYGMCILQDFEGVTPNLLARTIETVEGGGVVVLLLKTMKSLKQLYTMSMDIHSRYRTESHNDVVSRFNERFLLSLSDCRNCLVVDDELNVLPISGARNVKALPPARGDDDEDDDEHESEDDDENAKEERKIHAEHLKRKELIQIKQNLEEVQPAGSLVGVTKTVDQAKAVLTFIDAIAEKSLRSTVTLTASRGRGKSAALGIAIAAAIAHGYSNIFISSPSPENLKTLFEFIFKGFDALAYEEHLDYDIIQSLNPEFNKAIVRVNVFRNHRQTIQYIQPTDAHVLGQAELVVIDEAAAIPLPLVKKLMGPYLVFMASTINGYEGTGRSLSLKLIQQLREQSRIVKAADPLANHKEAVVNRSGKPSHETIAAVGGRVLREITLEEPIRYAPGDPVEHWLNKLLCLDATVGRNKFPKGSPHPSRCQLYYVNRDTLFSYHPVSEAFLHRMMALYVASHYKNSPNDLQLLSDAPAHQLYVLLPPIDDNDPRLPEPLCVVQLALEGEISKQSVANSLSRGERPSGDLIPWLVTNQFLDNEFATLSGARVVRIATHPDFMDRGYGSRALELLQDYFEGKFTDLNENGLASEEDQITRVTDQEIENSNLMSDIKIRDTKSMPPLLLNLQEKNPHYLHYMGVSFGLTQQLFKFWKRSGYTPVYIRQTANELTGEYTSVLLKTLAGRENAWIGEFSQDFHKRFQQLLSYSFRSFPIVQGLSVLEASQQATKQFGSEHVKKISRREDVDEYFTPYDLKRLESYANNLLDHHAIIDLLPQLGFLYFSGRVDDLVQLSAIQSSILLGIGLQHKSLDEISKEINLPNNQVMAMFAKAIRKFSSSFRDVITRAFEESLPADQEAVKAGAIEMVEAEQDDLVEFNPVDQALDDELEEGADEALKAIREKQRELINSLDMGKYAIGGDDSEWKKVDIPKNGLVSVRSEKKRKPTETAEDIYQQEMDNVKKQKSKKKSKK